MCSNVPQIWLYFPLVSGSKGQISLRTPIFNSKINTDSLDLFGLGSNLIFYIDERLRDLEVWNQKLGNDSFLIFLAFLYLQCYSLLPSLVIFIKELPGNARLAPGFFPDIPWSITKDFVYLKFTYNLADGTAGVNIPQFGIRNSA